MKLLLAAIVTLATAAIAQTVTITQKGLLTLTKDGEALSQHADERNAVEKALNSGPGTYLLKRTDIEVKVTAVATPTPPVVTLPPTSPAPSSYTTLPLAYIDTTYAAPSTVVNVPAGGSLQAAINSAQPGTTILLQAGATYPGPITLPNKTGSGWIYVRSSGTLPSPGNRVTPANASAMATITGNGSPVIALQTAAGAHHYRFVGIEFKPSPGTFATALIRIGAGETTAAALPNNITFDRCYMHGDPAVGGRRAVAMNGAAIAVIDSYVSDWREVGADSQALIAWNSPGPLKIVNNYLEGAGENVMFGGADPSVPGLVQSDIEVRGNHLAKPVTWRGSQWTVKNLFEIKHARRILIEGNVMEFTWAAAQDFAVNIKASNQDSSASQTTAEDVTFRLNVVRHASNAIKLCANVCDGTPTAQGKRFLVQHNLFDDISSVNWGGAGVFLQTSNNVPELVIDRNTVNHNGSIFNGGDGGSSNGFRFTGNIVSRLGGYGFKGSGQADGTGTLNAYFPGHVFTGNAIVGGSAATYPAGNTYPATYAAVPAGVGADMALVSAATRCTLSGQCAP